MLARLSHPEGRSHESESVTFCPPDEIAYYLTESWYEHLPISDKVAKLCVPVGGATPMIRVPLPLVIVLTCSVAGRQESTPPVQLALSIPVKIGVDGAPNAYGPPGKPALDYELNAHRGAKAKGEVVGYLTKKDTTPEIQGPNDPAPGYYISATDSLMRAIQIGLIPEDTLMRPGSTMWCLEHMQRSGV